MLRVDIGVLREGLLELSDEAFQRRVWTNSAGDDVMSSLVECLASVFDDSGLTDALDRGDVGFNDDLGASLRRLDSITAAIDQRAPVEQLLDDPALRRAREEAAHTLRLLDESAG
ncbi:hypothetical protein ACFQ46_20545 [Kineococcus sp. GCM10028916]|uniref:hypothetical protein n=1 Tax=Kineococcus sp. GCM10028916 TaxID=3273394 RepID=UPI0036368487